MNGRLETRALAALLALVLAPAAALAQAAPGIYSCVDAKGRRLTSDRPIPECIDREQKLMNATGGVRAVVPPPPTARERDAREEQERRLAEDRNRQAEERRAQRALLTRYPSQAVHDNERAKALQAVQDLATITDRQGEDLNQQKKKLLDETEFYKRDPARYPARLKRLIEDNEQQLAAQRRSVLAHEEEKKRVNARFDEELARLKVLWAARAAVATGAK